MTVAGSQEGKDPHKAFQPKEMTQSYLITRKALSKKLIDSRVS